MTSSLLAPVAIPVADLIRTARFYDAFLGPLGFRRLAHAGPYLGYTNGPISLWFVAAGSEGAVSEERPHVAFEVASAEEVSAFAHALRNAGVAPHREPDEHRELRPGAVSALWLDPDGAVVEVHAPRPRRVAVVPGRRRR